jgi:A1 cistron-splicing factor AAR2
MRGCSKISFLNQHINKSSHRLDTGLTPYSFEMAEPSAACCGDSGSSNKTLPIPMDTDAGFHAEPLHCTSASKIDDYATKTDPTFMQNQISIQRSPSATQSQASALSRKLSLKSNDGHDPALNQPAIAGILSDNGEQEVRGRGRGGLESSVVDGISSCNLKKSSSNSTDKSTKSTKSERSTKSVHSVNAVGTHPLGTLRVHSPSPTRHPTAEAAECLKGGDIVIVRDVPPGTTFGYDTVHFVVGNGEKFEGLKDIPAGAHFIWGGSSLASLRTGAWIMSAKRASDEVGEIHVKRWNSFDEVLTEEISVAETRIQKESVPEIFTQLRSYSLASRFNLQSSLSTSGPHANGSNLWQHLTFALKGALLTRITGKEWNQWMVSSASDYQPEIEASIADDPMGFRRDEMLKFVFPKSDRTFSRDSVGRDRTEQAMDTSSHIMAVITGICTYEDEDEIIGELQFCYITGMVLGNIACMEHWAHMVKVLFRAFRLAVDKPLFFRKVITAVHAQFVYDEEGFESSILDHDPNLTEDLKMLLTVFKSRLNELLLAQHGDITDDQNAAGKAFEELESWLWKWNWDLRGNYVRSGKLQLEDGEFVDAALKDFEAEDERGMKLKCSPNYLYNNSSSGEYAPVVVDLDEAGREKGLICL